MKFSKTIPKSIFAMILLIGIGTITVSAQEQSKDKPSERPVVVYYYYDPFMARDRWWYDPYRNDPFFASAGSYTITGKQYATRAASSMNILENTKKTA